MGGRGKRRDASPRSWENGATMTEEQNRGKAAGRGWRDINPVGGACRLSRWKGVEGGGGRVSECPTGNSIFLRAAHMPYTKIKSWWIKEVGIKQQKNPINSCIINLLVGKNFSRKTQKCRNNHKEKINMLAYKKRIKAFCISKDIVKKVKRQVICWGKYLRHKERDSRFF